MVNLTVAIANDRPDRRRRRLHALRLRSLATPEIPRRSRRRIGPQPELAGLCKILRLLVFNGVFRPQLFRIITIEPRHATTYYVEYDLPSVGQSPHNPSYLGI